MKHILTLSLLLMLVACSGRRGEVVIRGHFANLNQADFYIYTLDDGRAVIDTIHVRSGRFEYIAPLTGDVTYHLIYPHYAEQIVFASGGDVIDIEGDASNLREVRIDGNKDNKEYTRLRHAINQTVTDNDKDSLIDECIMRNPEARLSVFLQRQKDIKRVQSPVIIKGERLPDFFLTSTCPIDTPAIDTTVTDTPDAEMAADKRGGRRMYNADTLCLDDIKGNPVIIAFWAHWCYGSNQVLHQVREAMRDNKDLIALTYSADIAFIDHRRDIRADSCLDKKYSKRWYAYCDLLGPHSGLFAQWRITEMPYYILTDTCGVVRACGTDYVKDIKPVISSLAN